MVLVCHRFGNPSPSISAFIWILVFWIDWVTACRRPLKILFYLSNSYCYGYKYHLGTPISLSKFEPALHESVLHPKTTRLLSFTHWCLVGNFREWSTINIWIIIPATPIPIHSLLSTSKFTDRNRWHQQRPRMRETSLSGTAGPFPWCSPRAPNINCPPNTLWKFNSLLLKMADL